MQPMTPVMQLQLNGDSAVMLVLIESTARRVFPDLHTASPAMAVSALLAVDVPYQLVTIGESRSSRVAYVRLLGDWIRRGTSPSSRRTSGRSACT